MSLAASLFSGAVGGLLIMLVQNYLRNRKEEHDREEELRGLLRIVDAEMSNNEDILTAGLAVDLTASQGAQVTSVVAIRDLEAEDWERTKVRLAQFADEDHFTKLHEYYKLVTKTSMRADQIATRGSFSNQHLDPIQGLAQDCKTASDTARSRSKAVLSNN